MSDFISLLDTFEVATGAKKRSKKKKSSSQPQTSDLLLQSLGVKAVDTSTHEQTVLDAAVASSAPSLLTPDNQLLSLFPPNTSKLSPTQLLSSFPHLAKLLPYPQPNLLYQNVPILRSELASVRSKIQTSPPTSQPAAIHRCQLQLLLSLLNICLPTGLIHDVDSDDESASESALADALWKSEISARSDANVHSTVTATTLNNALAAPTPKRDKIVKAIPKKKKGAVLEKATRRLGNPEGMGMRDLRERREIDEAVRLGEDYATASARGAFPKARVTRSGERRELRKLCIAATKGAASRPKTRHSRAGQTR